LGKICTVPILESREFCPKVKSELKIEMALYLYEHGRLSIGKARELANMSLWEFRQQLAARRIAPHYDVADLEEDLNTLRRLGRL
jgi:predicted HTH domain antitoxin